MATNPCTALNYENLACVLGVIRALPAPARSLFSGLMGSIATLSQVGQIQEALDFRQSLSDGLDLITLPLRTLVSKLRGQLQQIYNAQADFADCPAVNRAMTLMRQQIAQVESYLSGNEVKKAALAYYTAAESQKQREATQFLVALASCINYYSTQLRQVGTAP